MDNPRFRSLTVPARVFLALLGAVVLTELVSLYRGVRFLGFLWAAERGPVDLAAGEWIDRLALWVGISSLVLLLVAGVAFIAWFHRAYRNLPALGVLDLPRGPGWAVGCWLIPFVSYVLPKYFSDVVWRSSEPGLPVPARREQWCRVPVPVLHTFWWAAWVVASAAELVGRRLPEPETLGALRDRTVVFMAADLLLVVAAALVVPVVLGLTARQAARMARLHPVDLDPGRPG